MLRKSRDFASHVKIKKFKHRFGEKSEKLKRSRLVDGRESRDEGCNQHGMLTVSSVLEGEYGLSGVSLGVPCIVSQKGIERVLQVSLPPDEQGALVKSAAILREAIGKLES